MKSRREETKDATRRDTRIKRTEGERKGEGEREGWILARVQRAIFFVL